MAELKISKKVKDRLTTLIPDSTFERETVKKVKDANPKRKIEYEIGDTEQDDFYPQVKLKHWGNEVNFSMRLVAGQGVVTEDDGKLAFDDGEKKARFYEIDDTDFEDGAFEFDIVLPKKPKSNVIEFTVRAKEVKAYFQPELTQEEIDEGAERPERFVKSWALYHASKRDNVFRPIPSDKYNPTELQSLIDSGEVKEEKGVLYELDKDIKTGKFGHIPRPYYTDAKGNKVWCEIELPVDAENNLIDGGIARLTLADEYKKAAYPVVVDPTFGNTSVGASSISAATSAVTSRYGTVFTGADGTLDSLHAAWSKETSESITFYVALNERDSVTTDSHGEVALIEDTQTFNTTAAFKSVTASSESVSSATEYIINTAASYGGSTNTPDIHFDTTDTKDNYSEAFFGGSRYADSKESPWTDSVTSLTRAYSIYATYTASGGSSSPIKVKVGGTFQEVTPKVKVGGTFTEYTPQIKQGGSFS